MNEAAGEPHSVICEIERTDHAIAIEPMPVPLPGPLEPRRAVDIVGAAQPLWQALRNAREFVTFFHRIEQEAAFQPGGKIFG